MMATTKVTLANIVLGLDPHVASCPSVVYNADGDVDYCEESDSLAFEGSIDFLTYFNALSWAKWKRYTCVESAWLHIELVGDPCTLRIMGVLPQDKTGGGRADRYKRRVQGEKVRSVTPMALGDVIAFEGSAEAKALDIPVPEGDYVLVGFQLESSGATEMANAYWYSEVDAACIRPVRIAIATTTYRKEEYIVPNIGAIRESVLNAGCETGESFHMYVVDNGSTLDAEALSDEGVTVIPNANVGGAGGFARGMIAALEGESVPAGFDFTHVLLMDDDIKVFPESLIRTRNLLSLLNDAYAGAFLNGAMLSMQQPSLQFEDVAFVGKSGNYARIKGDLFVDELADAVGNETIDVEVPRSYGAWWYSCIPIAAIKENGLPLPFFVRCDDVEFGLRNNAKYMTMNGICVWHDSFEDKFNATMAYQSYRNQLITDAIHGIGKRSSVPMIIERALRTHLRSLNYDAADLIVSSLEDYLKGPRFIMSENPQKLLAEHNDRSERLTPLADAISQAIREHPELRERLEGFAPSSDALKAPSGSSQLPIKALRLLPYDKHLLPDVILRDKLAVAYVGESLAPDPSQLATRVIVACDRTGKNAHVRFMDKARYKAIMNRWHTALGRFRAHEAELRDEYKAAVPEMTGIEFWNDYLDRANGEI